MVTESAIRSGACVGANLRRVAAVGLSLAALVGCGSKSNWLDDGGSSGFGTICVGFCDAGAGHAGATSGSSSGSVTLGTAIGTTTASDCPNCQFPGPNALPCAASAPAIKVVYPNDTVLVPPNMNVISVHFTPSGAPFTSFSVDFANAPGTDWHIVTKCAKPTVDAQSGMPSGGCEVVVDPISWSKLVGANRGTNPITISVRGTTDGTCASASTNQVHLSIAEEDLVGTYYYWKSQLSMNGVGGQIWKKTFGDLNTPEKDVTSQSVNATCNGCHSLSRDGSRMVVYSDDDDSDDEYSDIAGSYLDMTKDPATEFPGGIMSAGWGGGGQPPGFSTVDPTVTAATSAASPGYYLTSNGYPCTGAGCGPTNSGYPAAVPLNGWSIWNGTNGAFIRGVAIGNANTRPTMPDWSPDGKTLVYVVPGGVYSWTPPPGQPAGHMDDDHIYGGSLYTVAYAGNGTLGAVMELLKSNGENNYYPSYSPDVPMSYVIFNRVDNMHAGATCANGFCPDDSFSNPAARLMLLKNSPGSPPIDMEKANGSPVTAKVPWSNSYPRWAPFVQTYHGQKLLWFTFSSTRDYGLRVLNHKKGMYQCYPSDSAESPGTPHHMAFAPECQEPQLWMAPINLSEAQGNTDPSRVAFWIPYQDIGTHNHTAQWTQQRGMSPPPPTGGPCTCSSKEYGPCGAANGGCGCCPGLGLVCTGNSNCFLPPH